MTYFHVFTTRARVSLIAIVSLGILLLGLPGTGHAAVDTRTDLGPLICYGFPPTLDWGVVCINYPEELPSK